MDVDLIRSAWDRANATCEYCRLPQVFSILTFEVDHIIPLHGNNVSGLHVPWNLKVIFKTVNRAKSTLIVEEW